MPASTRTPGKCPADPPGFVRINLFQSPAPSPKKNLTGSPRVAKDIAADVYNNVQHWNDDHLAGAEIVKQIAIAKSNNLKDYTPELEDQVNSLYKIVQKLSQYVDAFKLLYEQIKALALLEKGKRPLFISMSVEDMVSIISEISEAYRKEFEMKQYVLENIAHLRNKSEVMFLAAAWTYQNNITKFIQLKLEALVTETGHKKIE